jgi:NADPH-dependent F420 reductase
VQVGIIGGTGPLGRGLGLRLADAGAQVVIGSRDEARAAHVVADMPDHWADRTLDLKGAGNGAAAACETVVVATPWDAAVSTVKPLAPALHGKVVVSVANALVKVGREMHALVPARGSMAAELQAALPGSFVAAAGHHLPASELENLGNRLNYDVLVCADHEAATKSAMGLVASIDGLRPLDAGSLASAAAVEAFTAVLVTLNIRYKGHSSLRLSGLDSAGGGER